MNVAYELRMNRKDLEILPVSPYFSKKETETETETEFETIESPSKTSTTKESLRHRLNAIEKLLESSDKSIEDRKWREETLKLLVTLQLTQQQHERQLKARDSEIRQLSATVDCLKTENTQLKEDAVSLTDMLSQLSESHKGLNGEYKEMTSHLIQQEQEGTLQLKSLMKTVEDHVKYHDVVSKAFQERFSDKFKLCEHRIQSLIRNIHSLKTGSRSDVVAVDTTPVGKVSVSPKKLSQTDISAALEKLNKLEALSKKLLT